MFEGFATSLCNEIRMRADEISDDVNTLYIGGGTPSVLPLYVYENILSVLKETGHGGPYEEFTVEVNPEDIIEKGVDYVKGLLRLGVNRISMGVQSFDDTILKFMNRRHNAEAARIAYSILEEAGVQNISIDLIFGLPQLSDELWQETLDKALSISPSGRLPQHISSYQLSIEPGSMLAKLVEKGCFEEASEEHCQRQYDMLCKALADAGYDHYEISNFALPGHQAMHNSAYWRHIPYTGFGPGAHSFAYDGSGTQCTPVAPSHLWAPPPTRGRENATYAQLAPGTAGVKPCRSWNQPDLKKYIESLESVREGEELTEDQLILERIMLALRTSEGISETFLKEHCDPQLIAQAISSGDLVRTLHKDYSGAIMLRIPESRFFISDAIINHIV